jgi:hypothetical protein
MDPNFLSELMWQSAMHNHVKTLNYNGLKNLLQLREHWTASKGVDLFDDDEFRPSSLMRKPENGTEKPPCFALEC